MITLDYEPTAFGLRLDSPDMHHDDGREWGLQIREIRHVTKLVRLIGNPWDCMQNSIGNVMDYR